MIKFIGHRPVSFKHGEVIELSECSATHRRTSVIVGEPDYFAPLRPRVVNIDGSRYVSVEPALATLGAAASAEADHSAYVEAASVFARWAGSFIIHTFRKMSSSRTSLRRAR